MEPAKLNYQKQPPHWRRRRLVWLAFTLVFATVVIIWNRSWLSTLPGRVNLLWRQHQCMVYSNERPDIVVFADGCWGRLWRAGAERTRSQEWQKILSSDPQVKEYVFKREWDPQDNYCAGRVPNCWHAFFDAVAGSNLSSLDGGGSFNYLPQGTIFLGQLRSESGHVRLVSVNLTRDTYWNARQIRVDVVVPGTFRSQPIIRPDILPKSTDIQLGLMKLFSISQGDMGLRLGFRVCLAYRVPNDNAAFEAKVLVGSFSGKLTGRLLDNDNVELTGSGIDPEAIRAEEAKLREAAD